MPIIGNVGRRSFKVRFLNTAIHVVLILGALTMLYPFLIMVSGSFKSAVDSKQLTAVPAYFYSETMLYKKWFEAKYDEDLGAVAISYRRSPVGFHEIEPPARPSAQRYEDWNAFLDQTEADNDMRYCDWLQGHAHGMLTRPEMHRRFVQELKTDPGVNGDIEAFNDKYDTTFREWGVIGSPYVGFVSRENATSASLFTQRILDFCKAQPRGTHLFYSMDSLFVELAMQPLYGSIEKINEQFGTSFRSWKDVRLSQQVPDGPLREPWSNFVRNRLNLLYIDVTDDALPDYQAFLTKKYEQIQLLNARYETQYESFADIPLVRYQDQNALPEGVALNDWNDFITEVVNLEHIKLHALVYLYRDFLKEKYGTLDALVEAQELGLPSFEDLALLPLIPQDNSVHANDWIVFARKNIPSGWVGPAAGARRNWIEFLTKPYTTIERVKKETPEDTADSQDAEEAYTEVETVDMDALNAALGTDYASTAKMSIPLKKPSQPELAERWLKFITDVCPGELLRVDVKQGADAWQEYIRDQYSDVAELNARYGFTPANFDEVDIPQADQDWFTFVKDKKHIFWEFFGRNYAIVFQMMARNGRAIINTVIYCALAIITALLVNPLAAYAMSRYKPPSQYKLLLLLMLTMAFPPMVLGIPNFLLLRDLKLLNTFAALVLPGMANGYMIFLLKGFFDALPRELYESAQLDGASEWTMFWNITMSTSKPILAVIALGAFTGAYSNFMFALIVCQNPKMWTMMVHLYQLQSSFAPAVSFASIVIAAIPTLLVFIFCQNIIIRGIVVPTEK